MEGVGKEAGEKEMGISTSGREDLDLYLFPGTMKTQHGLSLIAYNQGHSPAEQSPCLLPVAQWYPVQEGKVTGWPCRTAFFNNFRRVFQVMRSCRKSRSPYGCF